MTDSLGTQVGATVKYLPFGEARASVNIPTDKLFTGQRLDGTGLYFYNARYYDPSIGRFISPDTVIPHPADPQSFNRYSYCRNNPLKYTDPSGHDDGNYDPQLDTYKEIAYCNPNNLQQAQLATNKLNAVVTSRELNIISKTNRVLVSRELNLINKLNPNNQISGKSSGVVKSGTATSSTTKALVPYDPPNGGALYGWSDTVLTPGSTISRFGLESGKYVSLPGVPPQMRSLPPNAQQFTESTFEVLKYIPFTKQSITAPWYGQIGGGLQYKLPFSISDMIRWGYIK